MASPPQSTKSSLAQRLDAHARAHWPQLAAVQVRFRGQFAYLDGQLPDGEVLPLYRLRYGGSASTWGFALYLASKRPLPGPGAAHRELRRQRRGRPRLRVRPLPVRAHALTPMIGHNRPPRTYGRDHLAT